MICYCRNEFSVYPWFNLTDENNVITTIAYDQYTDEPRSSLLIAHGGVLSTFALSNPAGGRVIVGNSGLSAYREGTGSEAIFSLISSFVQISPIEVIILDQGNDVIRSLNRSSNSTTQLIGRKAFCTEKNVDGSFDKACVYKPFDIVKYSSNLLYVIDNLFQRVIRKMDLEAKSIVTIRSAQGAIALAVDPSFGLYVMESEKVYQLDVGTEEITKLIDVRESDFSISDTSFGSILPLNGSEAILLGYGDNLHMLNMATRTLLPACSITGDDLSSGETQCSKFPGKNVAILQWNTSTMIVGTDKGSIFFLNGMFVC